MKTRAAVLRGQLITRRYGLDDINQGYRDMLEGRTIRGIVVHEH